METKECNWVKKRLGLYLDNEVDSIAKEKIEKHLSACDNCRKELFKIRELYKTGYKAFYNDPPQEYWEGILPRIKNKLGAESRKPKVISLFRNFLAYNNTARHIAGAVAAAAIILIVVQITKKGPDSFQPAGIEYETEQTIEKPAAEAVLPQTQPVKKEKSKPVEKAEKKPLVQKENYTETQIKEILKKEVPEPDKGRQPREEVTVDKTVDKNIQKNSESIAAQPVKKKTEEPAEIASAIETSEKIESETDNTAPLNIQNDEKEISEEIIQPPKQESKKWYSFSKKEINNYLDKARNNYLSDRGTPPVQGFKQSRRQEMLETTDTFNQQETPAAVLSLVKKKNELLEKLKNNNDSVQKIILLYELDDIYVKILSFEQKSDIIAEAESFYIKYEEELNKIIGLEKYKQRIKWLKQIQK